MIKLLTVHSFDTELDINSVYSTHHLTVTDIANVLRVSRPTIYKYSAIAWSVNEYTDDFPFCDTMGILEQEHLYTPYQIWVISRVKVLMNRLKNKKRSRRYIEENQMFFCKSRHDTLDVIVREKIA